MARQLIRFGCAGDDVLYLQQSLNRLGYNCGNVDGIFGNNTKKAVLAFQQDHGLEYDGIVGNNTWSELELCLSQLNNAPIVATDASTAINKLIQTAKSEVGTKEGINNYNKYSQWFNDNYSKFYGWNVQNQPWCDIFADYCYLYTFGYETGRAMTYQKNGGSALCRTSASYYSKNNSLFTKPQAGDQVFFPDSSGVYNHTGIVVKVDNNYFYTVEGNSSDKVSERRYSINGNYGFGRPNWSLVSIVNSEPTTPIENSPSNTPETQPQYEQLTLTSVSLPILREGRDNEYVRAAQQLLNLRGYNCGKADGIFGSNTKSQVIKIQTKHNLAPDGIIGADTWPIIITN